METLWKYLAIALGGAIGSMVRYYLGTTALSRWGAPFPTATFVINITGSFILGFFLTLIGDRFPVHPNFRLAVAVGFVGAYTTFSTFEFEAATLVAVRDVMRAAVYVALSVAVGFAAVWFGMYLAKRVAGAFPARVITVSSAPSHLVTSPALTTLQPEEK
ncbi:MAG TPA: fluoride efflux transporter CrcB [Acidobacteriota bacterium]|nr:fluoride efflux transporter CrcB [Acidobacteriota bacterium]HNG93034.1 fluoride efflux transporter CrcB [Acidobacteriota bacterium]HNH83928.1 fluoride efflux transporter CrcB [Acidobacteriota bacterium]HNJ43881.1 fluoride efflux transporter CrcB [Acidobacteriota bacterium]